MQASNLIVTAWLALAVTFAVASTPAPTPTPASALSAGQASTQLELGNIYRKEDKFQEADAAYVRALQSEDPKIREKALRAIEHSLHEERDYGFWLRRTAHDLLETGLQQGSLFLPLGVLALAAWYVTGNIGTKKGSRQCVILATDKEDPNLATLFRLAYLSILAQQERRRGFSGPVGTQPMTPTLESGTTEGFLPQLISIASEKAGKIAGIFFGRLKRPRYRLSVGTVGDQYQTRVVVSLEVKGRVVEVWNQKMAVPDLFESDYRFWSKRGTGQISRVPKRLY
jgi:tetratricopeptide (TPR) repeat protein